MNERVYLVEDEPLIASSIRKKLEQQGFTVAGHSTSGEAALRAMDRNPPDLVIMDIKLHGQIDGVETADRVRQRYDVPVVFLTAFADEATVRRAAETEPFGYLVKPFTDRELAGAIAVALYRHQLERSAREREEQYRLLSQVTTDYAFCVRIAPDPENDELLWSIGSTEALLGPGAPSFRTIADALYLVHPDDAPEVSRFCERLRSGTGGQPGGAIEFRTIDDNGNSRWCRLDAGVISDRRGTIEQIYGSYKEVTALHESERPAGETVEVSRFLQTMRHGVWMGDAEGRCIYVNPALCELSGYRREQLVGRLSLDTLLGDQMDLETDSGFAAELRTRGGTLVPVLVTPQETVSNGTDEGKTLIFANITNQQRSLQSAERERRKFDGAFCRIPVPALLIDSGSNTVIEASEPFLRITGFSRDAVIGSGVFGLADPGNRNDLNQMVRLLKERSAPEHSIRIRTSGDGIREFRVRCSEIVVDTEEALFLTFEDPGNP